MNVTLEEFKQGLERERMRRELESRDRRRDRYRHENGECQLEYYEYAQERYTSILKVRKRCGKFARGRQWEAYGGRHKSSCAH